MAEVEVRREVMLLICTGGCLVNVVQTGDFRYPRQVSARQNGLSGEKRGECYSLFAQGLRKENGRGSA